MHNALVWLARIHLDLDHALVWLSIIAGFLSGALWFYASRIKVPTNLGSAYGGGIAGLQEMSDGFKDQAAWNRNAAVMTALTAVLQAFAQIVR